jgi:hypothetical protein
MNIDWTQIRGAIKRIESELAKAERVIEDTDVSHAWPEVSRRQLESLFPTWRQEYGSNWMRDFMERRIGKGNFRVRRGSSRYRIAPEVFRTLGL